MSASDPMFPNEASPYTPVKYGCSKLLYAMLMAPASEIAEMRDSFPEPTIADARRAWALAMIEESERV